MSLKLPAFFFVEGVWQFLPPPKKCTYEGKFAEVIICTLTLPGISGDQLLQFSQIRRKQKVVRSFFSHNKKVSYLKIKLINNYNREDGIRAEQPTTRKADTIENPRVIQRRETVFHVSVCMHYNFCRRRLSNCSLVVCQIVYILVLVCTVVYPIFRRFEDVTIRYIIKSLFCFPHHCNACTNTFVPGLALISDFGMD